jgi:hypothetical protein
MIQCIPPNPRRVGNIVVVHGPYTWATYLYTNTPPQPQLGTCYVEPGAELREYRGGQALGEYASKLGSGRDMEDPNIIDNNTVTNKVQVNLHMLRPLMLDRVGGEVHGADVVTVDERAFGEQAMMLSQELA